MHRKEVNHLAFTLIFSLSCLCSCTTKPSTSLPKAEANLANALLKSVKANGSFAYRIDLKTEVEANDYNLVRHCGAAWALATYGNVSGDARFKEAARSTLRFALDQGIELGLGRKALVSEPSKQSSTGEKVALLGSSALALAALATAGNVDQADAARALGQFIIYMQKSDGGFYASYSVASKKRSDDFASLYYPGEALLALTLLANSEQPENRSKWLEAIDRGFQFLEKNQRPPESVLPDNWLILAYASYELHFPERVPAKRKVEINNIVLPIVLSEIRRQRLYADAKFGCYSIQGDANVTAARLEGVLAAIKILEPNFELNELKASAGLAMSCILHRQIEAGLHAGAIASSVSEDAKAAQELRIDTYQHALMAMLNFEALGLSVPTSEESRTTFFNWSASTLAEIIPRDSIFYDLKAPGARLPNFNFGRSTLFAAQLNNSDVQASNFELATFEFTQLSEVRAKLASFRKARFSHSDLREADFTFSDFEGADFVATDLTNAHFEGASLKGARYDAQTKLPFGRETAARRGMIFTP